MSIITPTLNAARYLETALRSVEEQDYPRIEHIVVDGGSVDDTLSVVSNFPMVRVLQEPGSTMYGAINAGIRASQGDLLAYLNADDLLVPGAVRTVVGFLAAHQDVDMVYGDIEVIDETGRRLFRQRAPRFNAKLYVLMPWSVIPQPATFWRRDVHAKAGLFNPGLRYAGDFEFFARVAVAGCTIRHIRVVVAQFRRHAGSLSMRGKESLGREMEEIRSALGVSEGIGTRLLRWSYGIYTRVLLNPSKVLVRGRQAIRELVRYAYPSSDR
ncbi:MAG: glycosyltransferase family 2 protein [Bacteroidota bacterium]